MNKVLQAQGSQQAPAGSDPPAEKLRQVTHAVQSDQLEENADLFVKIKFGSSHAKSA